MRICTISLDAFGDAVLREPFFRALLAHGHEMAAAVRAEYHMILRYISPAITAIAATRAPDDVWAIDFETLERDVRAWRPDAIVVLEASIFTTPFAENFRRFLKRFGNTFRLGMTFAEAPREAAALGYSRVVKVGVQAHECEKYRKLLSAWLKLECGSRPVLSVPDDERAHGAEMLERLGLEPKAYAVSCPMGTTLIKNKSVPTAMSVAAARHLFVRHRLSTLFVGVADERADILSAIDALAAEQVPAQLWIGDRDSFSTLVGLLQQARLYFGCDTGPMHIAAALGLPVLAIFGGGTYPRFLPATPDSITLTQKMPCSPCAWHCPYPAPPPCIAMVRPDRIEKGLDRLLAGALSAPINDVGDFEMRWDAL